MKYFLFLFLGSLLAPSLFAQECVGYWVSTLDTDPTHPKPFSGDTNVGYGLFSFHGNDSVQFIVKGEFPKARFMSLQTYNTQFQKHVDSILDVDIEPDPGSDNPFRPGVPMDTNKRSFTLELTPESHFTGKTNEIRLPNGKFNHNFFYRIYSPHKGVVLTQKDLPRVYAYDAITHQPINCPKKIIGNSYLPIPQFVINIASKFIPFEFKPKTGVIGSNAGIPTYLYAITPLTHEKVVLVRFKAPTFDKTFSGMGPFPSRAETRYWSLCLQNFVHNETLGCLPDYLANLDANGFVTTVIGTGPDLESIAKSRGYNFLNDNRKQKQKIMGFVYRNVLPLESFMANQMYEGDYLPQAKLCRKIDFIRGGC